MLEHWLRLRLDPHAQAEIQVYAAALSKLIEERFPVSWRALQHVAVE